MGPDGAAGEVTKEGREVGASKLDGRWVEEFWEEHTGPGIAETDVRPGQLDGENQ